MKRNSYLSETATFLLVMLWTYAALAKIFQHGLFEIQLRSHALLSNHVGVVSWTVPAVELAIAVCLIFPATQRQALRASAILLVLFTGYLMWMLAFYEHVPCSCGGVIGNLSWGKHIIFNLAFLIISLLSILTLPLGVPKDIRVT